MSDIDDYFFDEDVEILDDSAPPEDDIILGIDLGTTNSCIGIWRNKNLEIVTDVHGNRTLPSVVAFTNKDTYIGVEAKNQTELNPQNCIYEVKRLIGRKSTDSCVDQEKSFLTYQLGKDEQDNVRIITNLEKKKNSYTPEEISALILIKAKEIAQNYLQREIKKAVITVPAYFNDAQRHATRDAARIAQLDCVRIINEPTAAALAYGLQKKSKHREEDINVIVYDLGGGTLDVSLLNICDGVFTVLASTGNTRLGGADFDVALIQFALDEFKRKNKIDLKIEDISPFSLQKLRKSCENAKKILSQTTKYQIAVKDFHDGKTLHVPITREIFEKKCRELFILCLKSVEDVLISADMEKDDIDEIILVGGGTRIPAIKNNLTLFFGGKEPNDSINPDEVVAAGAAIQGNILSGMDTFSENVVLLDIIPLSLGVETIGGVMTNLIPRNSVIPIRKKKKFTTDSDDETSVIIKIYEGERTMTKDNFFVGEFELLGLEPAPRGIAEIEVSFNVDVNGIISVTAEDLKNKNNKKSITINSNKGRLSQEEINELIREAEELKKKDDVEKDKKQMFYEIGDLCANVMTNLDDKNFKLRESDVAKISEDIGKVQEWLDEKECNERTKIELEKVLGKLRSKYGMLIMRISTDHDGLKSVQKKSEAVNIFDDDSDDEQIDNEQIECEEYGYTTSMGEEEKKQIKELRNSLIDLCYTAVEILNDDALLLEKEVKDDLKDSIDEALLWIHIKEKITKEEYLAKIEEVNRVCDQCEIKFEENAIVDKVKTKRGELEQLSYALLSSIYNNLFKVDDGEDKKLDTLKNLIEDSLNWLLKMDIDRKKAELENKSFDEPDETAYQKKIDEINECCNMLYNSMIQLNYEEVEIIEDNDNRIADTVGTTIQSLKEKIDQ